MLNFIYLKVLPCKHKKQIEKSNERKRKLSWIRKTSEGVWKIIWWSGGIGAFAEIKMENKISLKCALNLIVGLHIFYMNAKPTREELIVLNISW